MPNIEGFAILNYLKMLWWILTLTFYLVWIQISTTRLAWVLSVYFVFPIFFSPQEHQHKTKYEALKAPQCACITYCCRNVLWSCRDSCIKKEACLHVLLLLWVNVKLVFVHISYSKYFLLNTDILIMLKVGRYIVDTV